MTRQTSFHVRGNQSQPSQNENKNRGFFGKRPDYAQPAQAQVTDRNAVVRRQALRTLVADAKNGTEQIALLCELGEQRVKRLVEGDDILESALAMHIEEMLGLPSGWMESPNQVIPEDVLSKIRGEVVEKKEEDGFERFFETETPVPTLSPSISEKEVVQEASPIVTTQAELEAQPQEPVQPFQATQTAQPGLRDRADKIAFENVRRLDEAFPNIRQHMKEHTDLSAATVSGALTGKRPLSLRNQMAFEAALGLPENWFDIERSVEEISHAIRDSIGDLIDQPRPRRGNPLIHLEGAKARAARPPKEAGERKPRKPREVRTKEAVVQAKNQTMKHEAAEQPTSPKFMSTAFSATQAQPQAQPQAQAQPAEMNGTNMLMGKALLEMLTLRLETGRLDMAQITKIMNVLFL